MLLLLLLFLLALALVVVAGGFRQTIISLFLFQHCKNVCRTQGGGEG